MTSLRLTNLNTDTSEDGDDHKTPTSALVGACLARIDTRGMAKALSSDTPKLGLVKTLSEEWSKAVTAEIQDLYDGVTAIRVGTVKRDANDWIADHLGIAFGNGHHVVVCCHDPEKLLPAMVLASIDARIDMPPMRAAIVRQAVKLLTGKRMQGLVDADVENLDLSDLALGIRNGSKPADVVRRLKHMSTSLGAGKTAEILTKNALPWLADLPLPGNLADWANEMVGDLRAVASGALAPGQLRFGVLEGEPGTGKTLVAGALARSAGWRFEPISIGNWFNSSDGHLGGVSKACTAYFDALLAQDRVVGLIDEIDALPDRQTLDLRDRQWWTTVINLMLTQIDRLRTSGKPVFLLAATNYYNRLDAALIRPGRLEQRITVTAPRSEAELAAIFAHYAKGTNIDTGAFAALAPFARGATPAQIEAWVRQAHATARKAQRSLTFGDLMAAVAPIDQRDASEIQAVAQHEAGHAVVAKVLGLEVGRISIIATGGMGGLTSIGQGSSFPNLEEVENQATALLGGRAADVVLGQKGAHAGAQRDLEMATGLLTRAVSQWGLYDTLVHGEGNASNVSARVGDRLEVLLRRAIALVDLNRAAIEVLVDALLTRRLLQEAEINDLIEPLLVSEVKPHAQLD